MHALPQFSLGWSARACQRKPIALPEVPTSKEGGVPNFLMSTWFGFFAPAATPREIVSQLNRGTLKALEAADLRERMTGAGIDLWPGTSEDLSNLVRGETARYANDRT